MLAFRLGWWLASGAQLYSTGSRCGVKNYKKTLIAGKGTLNGWLVRRTSGQD